MSRVIICGRCSKELAYKHYRKHLNFCKGTGRFCPTCCKEVDLHGDELSNHLLNCQKKLYVRSFVYLNFAHCSPFNSRWIVGFFWNLLIQYWIRFNCINCGERFNTGRSRDIHRVKCGKLQASSKRRRVDTSDPPDTTTAIGGLFKIIEFSSNLDTPLIIEALHEETERLSDILR